MSAADIHADSLNFVWQDGRHARPQPLFENLSFTLEGGSFTAILGASGCGKTSLLRLLAGLTQPQSGRLNVPAQHVGYVFQDAALLDWKTAFDNVALPLQLAHTKPKKIETQVHQALKDVGLIEQKNFYPRQLSGGMKMRVALARALITKPQLLLMDEPFAALDEHIRHRLESDLHILWQQQGCTIVFVTHSLEESVYLAQNVWVMDKYARNIAGTHKITTALPRAAGFRDSTSFQKHCVQLRHMLNKTTHAGDAL